MNKVYHIDKSLIYDASGEYKRTDGKGEIYFWRKIFPRLPGFFMSYLDYSILDELGRGETAAETVPAAVNEGYHYTAIKDIQEELAEMSWAVAEGKLNMEDFLEELNIDLVPEYLNLPPLEWLEDVLNLLEKAIKERYGKGA